MTASRKDLAMDELLDEHEQGERVRAWLRDNALSLVGGIVLGLGAIFGWKWWQQHEHAQRVAVGEQYDEVVASLQSGELDAARAEVAALEAMPYRTLASLRLAKAQLDAGDRDAAIATLREARAEDPALQAIVDLRLARLLLDAGQADAALALVADADLAAALEVRGDAEAALGRRDAAQASYLQAIEALDADAPQRQLLEIKLVSAGGRPPVADGGDA